MLVLSLGAMLITRRLETELTISRWQCGLEIVVTTIMKQIEEAGLHQPEKYVGFLGTLFLFIAIAALATIIPGYESPTGSLSTTAALAICVFVAVPVFGIAEQGLRGYLDSYLKPTVIMLPFNIISELSRTLALARQHDERDNDPCHSADRCAACLPDRHERARSAYRHGAGLYLQHPCDGLYRRRDSGG